MKVRFSFLQQSVGIFVIAALAIILFATVYIIKDKKLFVKMYNLYTDLNRGDGISTTTKIIYKGIEVGYVNDVKLDKNNKIKVHMQVYPEFWKFLRGFTYIKVASGSFIGGKVLELVPQDQGEDLRKGAWIPSEDDEKVRKMLEGGKIKEKSDDMNKKIMLILNDVEVVVKNIKAMTSEMQKESSEYKQTMVNVRRITSNIATLTDVLVKTSPEIKQIVVDTQSAIHEANKMVKSTQESGVFRMLTPAPKAPEDGKRVLQVDTRDL